jgi:hypothetical protein
MSPPSPPLTRAYSASWERALPPLEKDVPDLRTLATYGLKAEGFTDTYLIAIITKAQPHHSNFTLGHLTRTQLIDHLDALVVWWKQVHGKSSRRAASIKSDDASSIAPLNPFRRH